MASSTSVSSSSANGTGCLLAMLAASIARSSVWNRFSMRICAWKNFV